MSYLLKIQEQMGALSDDVTFLNPYSYVVFRKRSELLKGFHLEVDGILLCWLLSLAYRKKLKRKSFDQTSLAPLVFKDAEDKNLKVAIVGSKPEEIACFIPNILQLYPCLNIVAYRDGYFKSGDEERSYIMEIQNEFPDILIVGMGSGRQEEFLIHSRSIIGQGYKGFSCGGFIHQAVGGLQYYPSIINKLNLRFFFRLVKEKNIWRRHLKFYPLFFCLFVYDWGIFVLSKFKKY